MDSDDNLNLSASPPPGEPSPSPQGRKLKRLKKAARVSIDQPSPSPPDERLPLPPVKFSSPKAIRSPEDLGFEESNGPFRSESAEEEIIDERESDSAFGGPSDRENRSKAKRVLEFDSVGEDFESVREEFKGIDFADLDIDVLGKETNQPEGPVEIEKKNKNKRAKKNGEEDEPKPAASSRRKTEKERRGYLQQLHVDSQRLLRETRDATFRPIPAVQKPISSVLEKIRKRKLEVSKKATILSYNDESPVKKNSSLREIMVDDSEALDVRGQDNYVKADGEETFGHPPDMGGDKDASQPNYTNNPAISSSYESSPLKANLDEKPMPPFRAPLDDTQDLYCDSEACDAIEELPNKQHNSPSEEVLAPSLLTMNLMLDSAPTNDVCADAEDNGKESIGPHLKGSADLRSPPDGDPVKAFVDEEAEEEDDSDNDLRFQESDEEENDGDAAEFVDLIATGNEEKAVDNEKRNQLHQRWLEEQDAAGMENLLQRLKYGSKRRDSTFEDSDNEEEVEEELSDEETEGVVAADAVKVNTRLIKQMIPQMFDEKEDPFLSSDDEETEKRLVKMRVLDKLEERPTFLSPAEDDSSREVFGLIKKLNMASHTRNKAKTLSIFDTMLTGGNSKNNFSKSSFLGRMSSQSLPLSRKRGSGAVRSFVFGRDDSNSRSSVSAPEEISEKNQMDSRPSRSGRAKFVSSQPKSSSQSTKAGAETISGTSLFEILRRSSVESSNKCSRTNTAGLSETVFSSFKCAKRSVKVERM